MHTLDANLMLCFLYSDVMSSGVQPIHIIVGQSTQRFVAIMTTNERMTHTHDTCLQCWTQVNASRRLLSPNVTTSVCKRFINYARLRTYWRIIRLKDRGVEHNF